ncbi:MAG: hypothetical protein ACI8Z7_000672 [Candidatus Nanohaloarchaea archaeon]|jgi:hypothetical protein
MGLIGWWPLHENSGRANDLSGNGNHGSLNGSLTQGSAGKGGLVAYKFDGSDDYVSISPTLKDPEFSVSLWVYIGSESSRNICFSQGGDIH